MSILRDDEDLSRSLSPRNSSIRSPGLEYEKETAGGDTMLLLGEVVVSPKSSLIKSPRGNNKLIDNSPGVASVGTRRKLFESCRQVMMKAKSRGRGQLLVDEEEDQAKRSKSRHRREKDRSKSSSNLVVEEERSKSRHRRDKDNRLSTKAYSKSCRHLEGERSKSRHKSRHDREEKPDKERQRISKSSRHSDGKDDSSRRHSRREHEKEHRSSKSSRHEEKLEKDDHRSSRSSHLFSEHRRKDESPSRRRRSKSISREEKEYRSSRSNREEQRKDRSVRSSSRVPRDVEKDRSKSSRSSRYLAADEKHSVSHRSKSDKRPESPTRSSKRSPKPTEEFTLSPSRSGRHLAANEHDSHAASKKNNNKDGKEYSLTPTKSQRHLTDSEVKGDSGKQKTSDHCQESEHSKSSRSRNSRRITVGSDDNTCSTSTISSKSISSKTKIRITQQEYLELKESIQKSRRASQKDILARLQSKKRLSKGSEKDHDRESHHHRDHDRDKEKEKRREERKREKEKDRRSEKKHGKDDDKAKTSSDTLDEFMQMRQNQTKDTSSSPRGLGLEPGFEIVLHPEPVKDSPVKKKDKPESGGDSKAFWETTESSPWKSPKSEKKTVTADDFDPWSSPKIDRVTVSPRSSASPSKLKIPKAFSPQKAQSCKTLMLSSAAAPSPRNAKASILMNSKLSPRKEQSARALRSQPMVSPRTLQSKPLSPRSRQRKQRRTLGLLHHDLAINEDEETVIPAEESTSVRISPKKKDTPPVSRPSLSRKSSWRAPSVGEFGQSNTTTSAAADIPKEESKDRSPRRPNRDSLQRTTSWRPATDLNDLDQELQQMKRSASVRLPVKPSLSGNNSSNNNSTSNRKAPPPRTSSWRPPSVREGPSRRLSEGLEPQPHRVVDKPRAVYTEEDIFTSYTWSLTRQDFYKVQKERLLLKDSIRDTALFRAYQKIVAVM